MKGFVFFLAVTMVLAGCSGGDAPPEEQAEMPTPALPDNIKITPVAELAPSTGEADEPGKLTLGKPPKKIQPGAKPTPKPNPETKDRKSTRLNSSHALISYAVFCLKKKKTK